MVWPFKKNTFKTLGFVDDQKGILRRFKREKQNWNEHLDQTKTYIQDQTAGQHFSSIAVLGSGFLLDLPVDHLLSVCDKLFLYDVNHPKEVKAKFADNPKVELVQKDITGLSEAIVSLKTMKDVCELISKPTQAWSVDKHDCIISLNILNQLDILLLDYLNENMSIPEKLELRLREKIQREHIDSFGDVYSILIADTEEIQRNTISGDVTTKVNIHTEIVREPSSSDYQNWVWQFDSSGRYIENTTVTFKVNAVTYNK